MSLGVKPTRKCGAFRIAWNSEDFVLFIERDGTGIARTPIMRYL